MKHKTKSVGNNVVNMLKNEPMILLLAALTNKLLEFKFKNDTLILWQPVVREKIFEMKSHYRNGNEWADYCCHQRS